MTRRENWGMGILRESVVTRSEDVEDKDEEHDKVYFVYMYVYRRFSRYYDDDNMIREIIYIFRYIDAVEVARPRDMSRNHVVSTEYAERFLPTEIYRWEQLGIMQYQVKNVTA